MTAFADCASLTAASAMQSTTFATRHSLISATQAGLRREEFARLYEPMIRRCVRRSGPRLGLRVEEVDSVVQTSIVRLLNNLSPDQQELWLRKPEQKQQPGEGKKDWQEADKPGRITAYKRVIVDKESGLPKETSFSAWLEHCLANWIQDFVRQRNRHEAKKTDIEPESEGDSSKVAPALIVQPVARSHEAELLAVAIRDLKTQGKLKDDDLALLQAVADGHSYEELAHAALAREMEVSAPGFNAELKLKVGALRVRKHDVASRIKKAFRALEASKQSAF